eukprot:TRINITY_DN10731_c0_g1_i1.p1 TRINITY_DN10731_c0_g1~~TRINITY_DN10731_c0_g1_i1.p1  ORF type:complete len:256 (-),score=36.60 TRINITY_DN10731_c0_g1_i1:12-779(-)
MRPASSPSAAVPLILRIGALLLMISGALLFVSEVVILFVDWGAPCDVDLQLWLLVSVLRVPADAMIAHRHHQMLLNHDNPQRLHLHRRLSQLFKQLWFVVGVVLLARSQTCADTAPRLYIIVLIHVASAGALYVLSSCIVFGLRLWLPHWIRAREREAEEAQRTPSEYLEALPVSYYTAAPPSVAVLSPTVVETCAICLDDFREGVEIIRLPCTGQHFYHKQCALQWLRSHKSCPSCRQDIFARPIPSTVDTLPV